MYMCMQMHETFCLSITTWIERSSHCLLFVHGHVGELLIHTYINDVLKGIFRKLCSCVAGEEFEMMPINVA